MKIPHLVLVFCCALATVAHADTWNPSRNVEIVVPAAPGASFDITGRTVQRILQDEKLIDATSMVVNKAGGGGRIGMTYLSQHPGDAHMLSILTPGLLSNHILGNSPFNYTDFTPIAMLFAEYMTFAVQPDSRLKSLSDMAAALRKDPSSLSIAVATSRGGALHTAVAIAMKAAGIDVRKLKIVVFNANSESVTALLGGHVDIAVSPPLTIRPHLQSMKARVIAISSPRRLGGVFAQVPTWREQGVNATFASWRGIMAPKGVTATQVKYWEQVLGRLSTADAWKADVERNLWEVNYLTGSELRRYVDSQYDELKHILIELDLAKP